MSGFQPGEFVDITIKGVRMEEISHIRVLIKDESGELWVLPPQAAITRVAPAEWPPRPGDLWRDRHGTTWFAFYGIDAREVFMVPADPVSGPLSTPQPGVVLAKVGPLALVHREEAP